MGNELQQLALNELGWQWVRTPPCVSLTTDEVKALATTSQTEDEILTLRMPRELGYESAEIIRAALAQPKGRRYDQVTLLDIIGGTRLKYHFHGLSVPTHRPKNYTG